MSTTTTNQSSPVITRFAPSPTGHLHIGGARTALFCWAFAKGAQAGEDGRFLLRIEDTDQARSSESATRGILEDLAWLGIDWDDGPELVAEDGRTLGGDARGVGPFFQAQRIDVYDQYIEQLLKIGRAYPAFETTEELDAKRAAARAQKQTYRYDRAALEIPEAERTARMKSEPHVIRFKMPDAAVHVCDDVLGDVRFDVGEVDDFIIRKRDGFPTYHFAVVVDDELMGVTHILRGQEHLNNTPRHVAMQEALDFRTPVYAHMPLIFNMDGSKMSKRDKDKSLRLVCKEKGFEQAPNGAVDDSVFASWLKDKKQQLETSAVVEIAREVGIDLPEVDVEDFRRGGYLPEVLCNFLSLLGWSPGDDIEKFDNEFLKERFDLPRIGKTNAKFDRVKLLAFNNDALGAMSDAEFARRWREWCARYEPGVLEKLSDEQFSILAAAVRPRTKTLREAARSAEFALMSAEQIEFDEKSVEKALLNGDGAGLNVLGELRVTLAALPTFTADTVHTALTDFAASRELGMGKVAQPLRVALTGSTISPPIGETLAILGKDETLARIDRCLSKISASC